MDDIWLHVFARMPPSAVLRLRGVCRRWNSLASETIRRRSHLDLNGDFPGCIQQPENIENIIAQHSAGLLEILIRVPAKTERFMVCASEFSLSRRCIRAICETAVRLKSLRIERMILTVGAMEQLAALPNSLKEFSLVNCALSCSSPEINILAQNSFRRLFKSCRQLSKFEIAMRGMSFEHFELTEKVLSDLPENVKDLNISAGKSLQIKSLNFLGDKRLRSLTLQRSFISSADLRYLIPMAETIVSLDLTSSINVLDTSSLAHLHNLKALKLGHLRDGFDDSSLASIAAGCQKLELISIEDLPRLTEASLCKIGSLRKLRHLTASGLPRFNDRCCLAILQCIHLEYVDLNFCRNISSEGVVFLLSLPHLEHLELLGVTAVPEQLLECNRRPKTLVCDIFRSPMLPLVLPPIPSFA